MIHAPDEWMAIVRKVLRFNLESGEKAILFGSRATGVRLKPHSDFDICIRGQTKLPDLVQADLRDFFSNSRLPVRVDVVDWFEAPPFLQEIIEKEGVEIEYQEKE